MKLLFALALVACAQSAPLPVRAGGHAAVDAIQDLPSGPATAVVSLANDVPTAVARGPFLITTINPGNFLTLGLAARACDEPSILWFGYSGGGVAVGTGQILCAWSRRIGSETQAFSGRTGGTTTAPP